MRRKSFTSALVTLGFGLFTASRLHAQRSDKVVRIGLLSNSTAPNPAQTANYEYLLAALRDLGWVDGKNLFVETRLAGPTPQRQREFAAELKALPVALIMAAGTTSIRSAREGAPGLPIVMVNAGDPLGSGFVASLARPGGDLTGTSAAGEEVLGKQVELLSAALPNVKRIGVLMNSSNPANGFFFDAMLQRAKQLGLQLDRIEVGSPGELDGAIARTKGGALVVLGDPMFGAHRGRIIEQTLRVQVPSMFGARMYAVEGGLMVYNSTEAWHWRKAAGFVDKILKGAMPADLAVQQPTEFELVINLKTAKAIGVTIPQALLLRADEVIE